MNLNKINNMKTQIIIIAICIFSSLNLFAQEHRNKGKACRLDNEKMYAEKVAFISAELNLSVSEAQNFWPLYNEFNESMSILFDQEREINHYLKSNLENASEKEISSKLDELMQIKTDRANLETKYHKKFCKVLPINKVALLYKCDRDFRKHLLRKYKGHKKEEK